MRFDDRLATVLALPREDAAARAAAWRQIVDLLAQTPPGAADPLSAEARALLGEMRARVPQAARVETMAALAGRRVHAGVVRLLADETPAVAAPLIGRVRLEDGEWLFLLPRLSIAIRALLRHRRDLSVAVRTGLASFGASDFALPPAAGPPAVPVDDAGGASMPPRRETPMGGRGAFSLPEARMPDVGAEPTAPEPTADLPNDGASSGPSLTADGPESIAALPAATRPPTLVEPDSQPAPDAASDDPREALAVDPQGEGASPVAGFRYETNADGVILWVEGAPRAALIGFGMAQALLVPDHMPQPFRRAPFRDARLTIPGGSPTAGAWRVSGVPVFDAGGGRFTGYRGSARRAGGDAPAEAGGLYGTGLQPDALRQLVHELRTPLNAIVGFGEMIERQVLGPAATPYRVHAGEIVGQGRRLLGVVDDLDMAARGDAQRQAGVADPFAPADLLRRLWPDQRAAAAARGVRLDLAIATEARIGADVAVVERMFAHLLAVSVGLGETGETIAASLVAGGGAVALRLDRPATLAGRDEATMLAPGFAPEGEFPDAPPLGAGFALRLVRTLAIAAGGMLEVEATRFVLRLPQAEDEAASR